MLFVADRVAVSYLRHEGEANSKPIKMDIVQDEDPHNRMKPRATVFSSNRSFIQLINYSPDISRNSSFPFFSICMSRVGILEDDYIIFQDMATVAELTDFISKSTQTHAVRRADLRRRPRANSVKILSTSHVSDPRNCVICGALECTVVAHRIAILQILRRSAKAGKNDGKKPPAQSSVHPRLPVLAPRSHIHIVRSPCAAENLIDPFTAFPVHGASKDMMRKFYDFFTQQGGFVTNPTRRLVFDQRGFAAVYPAAMQNPALCMSVVALATSYSAVHYHNRAVPDVETLSVHSQAFEMIRAQMDEEPTAQLVDFSISAVHRLAMACGIAFGDAEASITHWNGVLALLDRFPHLRSSGIVMGYVTQMEYWVAINPGVKPRNKEWPVLFPRGDSPPNIYGRNFSALFDLPGLQDEASSRLLSVCLTTCRATEVLESEVASAATSTVGTIREASPYFMHLFDVLSRQQAQLYTTLMYRNDVFECLCITLNVYFMVVIRCTPWRAPLEHLCVRLQDSLTTCEAKVELEASTPGSTIGVSTTVGEETTILNDLYLWMLVVCACALQLCRNRSCQDWALRSLRAICQDDLSLEHARGRAEVLRRMRRFCWSDTFLLCRFEELCSALDH